MLLLMKTININSLYACTNIILQIHINRVYNKTNIHLNSKSFYEQF